MCGGFAHRAFLHFRDPGRYRDDDPRFRAHPAAVHLLNKVTQHRFGHFEVRDDAIFQGPHGDDVGRRASEHPLRFIADCEHFVGPGLDRHDRRFTKHDALVFDVDERVRRPEVDADVAG